MLVGGDVRVCIAYSETDDEMENIMKDALDRRSRLHLARSFFLEHSWNNAEQCCGLPGWPPTDRCSRAIAGGTDEVRKAVEIHCGTQRRGQETVDPPSRCT